MCWVFIGCKADVPKKNSPLPYILMGGRAKSQKACRLKTSEAKFAKKPATYRFGVSSSIAVSHNFTTATDLWFIVIITPITNTDKRSASPMSITVVEYTKKDNIIYYINKSIVLFHCKSLLVSTQRSWQRQQQY